MLYGPKPGVLAHPASDDSRMIRAALERSINGIAARTASQAPVTLVRNNASHRASGNSCSGRAKPADGSAEQ